MIILFYSQINVFARAKTLIPELHTTFRADTDSLAMDKYRGKSYVFQKNIPLIECNAIGTIVGSPKQAIAPNGTIFTVQGITKNGDLIISFWIWALNSPLSEKLEAALKVKSGKNQERELLLHQIIDSVKGIDNQKKMSKQLDIVVKREDLNFKDYSYKQYVPVSINSVNDNKRYFLLAKDSLNKFTIGYKKIKKWDINYGTLVTPFKLRFNKFAFTNDLSVGGGVYYQKKIDSVWSYGGIFALSLSSVTLDASSTNPSAGLTSSTTRPAFSPSVHGVFAYKKINFIVGIGFDILSKPTDVASATNPEAAWIYNGKPWVGIGFGFNLFNGSSPKGTSSDAGQTAPDKK